VWGREERRSEGPGAASTGTNIHKEDYKTQKIRALSTGLRNGQRSDKLLDWGKSQWPKKGETISEAGFDGARGYDIHLRPVCDS